MKNKNKKLVIIGDGEFGEIAYEYFTYDSEYEVVGFAVEKKFRTKDSLYGKPIIDFEDMVNIYPPDEFYVFVAITHTKFNTVRTRLYRKCKDLGYRCASYVSSHAFVWHNAKIGENTFIFENSTIQHHAEIGNNVIVWSGGQISHRSKVGDNCWLAPHVVIAGFSTVGSGCFLGVNATVCDYINIAQDIILGAGSLALKSLEEKGQVYVGSPARLLGRTSYEQFGIDPP